MNLPKAIALTCSTILALLGNALSAIAAETQPANKTFADWCREKSALSPETRHTVEVLLQKVRTTDCKPLESLTNLSLLSLNNNQISTAVSLPAISGIPHAFGKMLYISKFFGCNHYSKCNFSEVASDFYDIN
ncbi:MAG: hypothetical protein ACRC62_22650 [Microcoleus sp.]